jgi:hypothetical protein
MANEPHTAARLEPPDVDSRAIVWTACAAVVLMLGTVAVLHAVYRTEVSRRPLPPKSFPQPRVQPDEADALHRLLAEQRRRLAGYAWVDRNQGIISIPIERAMQLIAQKGDKAYAPIAPSAPALASPAAGAQRATTPGQGPGTSGAAPAGNQVPPPNEGAEGKP